MSLLDRIIPPEALRWGRLTIEPFDWHIDMLRYSFAHVAGVIVAPFAPIVTELANIIADAAAAFPDIFPIVEDRP